MLSFLLLIASSCWASNAPVNAASATVMFHTHHVKAIYESTLLSDAGNNALFADGRNVNPQAYLGVIPLPTSTGAFQWSIHADSAFAVTPRFNHGSSKFGAHSTVTRLIGGNKILNTVSILGLFDSTAKHAIGYHNITVAGNAAVASAKMSTSGSVMAVAVNTDTHCTMHFVYAQGASAFVDMPASDGACGEVLINHDGSVVMMMLYHGRSEKIAIFDGTLGKLSKVVPLKVPGGIFCMNYDGSLFVAGYYQWDLMYWNATSQTMTNMHQGAVPSGWGLTHCTFTKTNELVNLYEPGHFDENELEAFDISTTHQVTQKWTAKMQKANTTDQDSIQKLIVDDASTMLLTVGWGDNQPNKVPTTRMFDLTTGQQVWAFHTPGSMFTGDLVRLRRHHYRVAIGGKAVHANVVGYGGDAYVIDVVV